jgi:hypothetical protein
MRFAPDVPGKNGHRVKSGLGGGKLGLSGESILAQERADATKMGEFAGAGCIQKGQCCYQRQIRRFVLGEILIHPLSFCIVSCQDEAKLGTQNLLLAEMAWSK